MAPRLDEAPLTAVPIERALRLPPNSAPEHRAGAGDELIRRSRLRFGVELLDATLSKVVSVRFRKISSGRLSTRRLRISLSAPLKKEAFPIGADGMTQTASLEA